MSIYHTPFIIRITLEFTNGILKSRKRDFLRTTKQELRAERSYVHFKRFTLIKNEVWSSTHRIADNSHFSWEDLLKAFTS